jgi:tetratricopeptide (TPR) repeat protein
MNPDDPGSYVLRAGAYKTIGRYDDAIADYTKAMTKQMEDDLLLERADCYRAVHRYDEALRDLDKAVEIDASNRVLVSALRAKIFQEKGEDQNARVELLELEKKHQTDIHKNDGLFAAVGVGIALFMLGLTWLAFKAWKKRKVK